MWGLARRSGVTLEETEPERSVTSGSASPRPRLRTSSLVQILVVVFAVLGSLFLRWRVPVVLNTSGADGLLFVRNAAALEEGDWFGRYSNFTLVKGPGYPFFIAVTDFLNIPLKVAEQMVYLSAVGALALVLLVTLRRPWVATIAFVVLAFDPASYGVGGADMLRDSFFGSLGLLAVALAFLTTLGVVRRARWVWVVSGAFLTGAVTALYWFTREEGVTLLPTLGCVAVGVPLLVWWSRRGARAGLPVAPRRPLMWRGVVALVVTLGAVAAPMVLVRAENSDRYGVALGNDMAEGSFLRAYADWSRVEAGSRQYRIPITEAQRRAVYPVSPAARELRPILESPDNGWRSYACRADFCDYGGGWMVWALRDAAAEVGHFEDGASAQEYFARLSDEITDACDSGELSCAPRLPASLQPVQRAPAGELAGRYLALAGRLVTAWGLYETPVVTSANDVTAEVRAEYTAVVDGLPRDPAGAAYQMAAFESHDEPYRVLAVVYHVLVPLLVAVALCGVVIGLVRAVCRRADSASSALLVLAVALLLGVAVRLFMLALIDTAEYDLLNSPRYPLPGYQLPGYVLLIGFGVVGTLLAFQGRRWATAPADAGARICPKTRSSWCARTTRTTWLALGRRTTSGAGRR